jgi:hypothetical protein
MPPIRRPNGSRQCAAPWAHSVQKYIHHDAIAAANSRALTHDQRLILVRDADVLVGIAVHYLEEPPDESGTTFERRLDAYATALDLHGKKLSTGEYASQAVLRAVVSDITTRHSPDDFVILTALVAPKNDASRKCLERYTFREEGVDDPYLIYATTLPEAQTALCVEPAPQP